MSYTTLKKNIFFVIFLLSNLNESPKFRLVATMTSQRSRKERVADQCASIAQLVEHLICNQGVPGSSPGGGTTSFHKNLLFS